MYTTVEPNLHYIWLGKKPSGKDAIKNVVDTVAKFYENYQQLNKDNNKDFKPGFCNYFIHTDNPDAIKEAFAEEEAKINTEIKKMEKTRLNNGIFKRRTETKQHDTEDYDYLLYYGLITKPKDINELKKYLQNIKFARDKIAIKDINKDLDFSKFLKDYPAIDKQYCHFKDRENPMYAGLSDILRYYILYKSGGLYLDFDAKCGRIDYQLSDRDIYNGKPMVLLPDGNGLIMLNKGNPIIIDTLEKRLRFFNKNPSEINKDSFSFNIKTSGPDLFTHYNKEDNMCVKSSGYYSGYYGGYHIRTGNYSILFDADGNSSRQPFKTRDLESLDNKKPKNKNHLEYLNLARSKKSNGQPNLP